MIVGVPKETKMDEYRVGLVPVGVKELTSAGHRVIIQSGAGSGSGISDTEYRLAGARIVKDPVEVWRKSDLLIKVKEPQKGEFSYLRRGQIVFTFFHFAAGAELTRLAMKSAIIAIAYETIRDGRGRHPILTPMSEVAGRMSIQEGAKYLERPYMGRGILLGGVPGVAPANVVILGGGVVGSNAAKVAAGLGAQVTILDIDLDRLRYLDDIMPKNVKTLKSDRFTIRAALAEADLLIGAVLVEGARTPVLVKRKDLSLMKPGAVIVDVAVDQGGCVKTIHPTTHSDPTFIVDNVVHYGVTNMPGAVGRTSTYALTNATLPYALEIASAGAKIVQTKNEGLKHGIHMVEGKVTSRAVAETFGLEYHEL